MKVLILDSLELPPDNFTGIVQYPREKIWYKNGQQHREDGPAIESKDGSLEWRFNDRTHRKDGPAFIDGKGNKWWFQDGKCHRIGGPAVECIGVIFGPKEWYVHGEHCSEEQHNLLVDIMKLKGLIP